jgi:antitoxin ParD1/3/4
MTTIRKSLTITQAQEQWIKLQIELGGFANDSEYLRHLIRMDEQSNRQFLLTKAAIQEGYESGVSSKVRTVEDIMRGAISRKKALDKGKSNG